MLAMVVDGTFLKTFERGLLGSPKLKKKRKLIKTIFRTASLFSRIYLSQYTMYHRFKTRCQGL